MSEAIAALFSGAETLLVSQDQVVFRAGDPVSRVYCLVEGRVDLVRHGKTGRLLILHRVEAGQLIAEASVYSAAYHCDGIARTPSRLLSVTVGKFHHMLRQVPSAQETWAKYLAHGLQRERLHSEFRTLQTVAARLDGWLDVYLDLPPRGQWQDLAHTLGISREALYRELKKRR